MKFAALVLVSFGILFGGGYAGAASFSQLDKEAKSLSVPLGQTPESVVENLVKPNYSDMEKARVLAAFVAYQMQKNGYAYKEVLNSSNRSKETKIVPADNVLKSRIGTALDYALLYRQLCQLAGLDVVAISGYAGMNVQKPHRGNAKLQTVSHLLKQGGAITEYGMQRYESVWNAVKVDGEWILVDTFWMVGGEKEGFVAMDIDNERKMETFLRRRESSGVSLNDLTRGKSIREDYFNAKPRQFVKTHYPFESEWQLLPNPVSFSSFLR